MADSDTLYHRLFSHPLMVEQLVRDFVPEAMAAGLDFSRMQRVNAKFHGRRGRRREGDVIWRLPTGDGVDIYLYLLFEFQSQSDWWMAVRTQVYEGLLWQHIVAEKKLKTGDRLPPVLLLTLYNGEQRWTAPTAVADLIALPPDSPLWPFSRKSAIMSWIWGPSPATSWCAGTAWRHFCFVSSSARNRKSWSP